MKTPHTFDTIPTLDLDAVTGGTLGPESGARDPGNDPGPCVGLGPLGTAFCLAAQEASKKP